MSFSDIPMIVRLVIALAVVAAVIKGGSALISFISKNSVENTVNFEDKAKNEYYMRLTQLRKVSVGMFCFGLILAIVFAVFVIFNLSNASIGHIVLFAIMAVLGLIMNIAAWLKQKKM